MPSQGSVVISRLIILTLGQAAVTPLLCVCGWGCVWEGIMSEGIVSEGMCIIDLIVLRFDLCSWVCQLIFIFATSHICT